MVYINTAGIGLVRPGLELGPQQVRPGDKILVSGPIAAHGIAVLSVRDGLEFGSDIVTDSQPLNGSSAALLDPGAEVSMMRDPTRGGLRRRSTRSLTRPVSGCRSLNPQCPWPTTCGQPARSWT